MKFESIHTNFAAFFEQDIFASPAKPSCGCCVKPLCGAGGFQRRGPKQIYLNRKDNQQNPVAGHDPPCKKEDHTLVATERLFYSFGISL
jgi:hypothetical protein